jgi:protein-S-isoprenylcysteine O-methyltransferase Ste14
LAAFTAFAAASLTIIGLVFGLVMVISTAQKRVITKLRTSVNQVRRWGGVVLIVVGAWLIILAIFANAFVGILFG